MAYLKKSSPEILAWTFLVIIYFIPRAATLSFLPIFTDEAIYIRWAQYLKTDLKFWDYALTDGKQPLFIWLISALMFIIPDPLLAGRLVSLFAGLITMIGLYYLANEAFTNKKIAYLTAFLYAVYPFALVYDRMALYDSLVGTFAVWGIYLVIRFMKVTSLKSALWVGFMGGLSVLNKSNGFFTIILLPVSFLLFDLKSKNISKRLAKLIAFSILAGVITFGIYSLLRISPFFHLISQKNAIFVYPLKEWLKHPFNFFIGNLWIGQRDWLVRYFGYTYLILVLGSFFIKKELFKEKLVLLLWFLMPFLLLALFGNTIYPRYIFFMTLTLLPLVAYTLTELYLAIPKNYNIWLVLLFLAYSIYLDLLIFADFAKAPIPVSDRTQYFTDWPSGYGIKESIKYFADRPEKKIAIFTQGTFGLLPYAYEIFLHDQPRYIIKGVWPIDADPPQYLIDSAKQIPSYIVFYQPCGQCAAKGKAPANWPLREVFQIKKPAPATWLTVYKVLP